MEQSDSQLMMADRRGLRSLDARRSERAPSYLGPPSALGSSRPDPPTSLDQLGERGLNAGRRVRVQLQRREDRSFGLTRELSRRFLDPS